MQILEGIFSILSFELSLEAVNELKDSQAESDSAEWKKERDLEGICGWSKSLTLLLFPNDLLYQVQRGE